MYLRQLKLTPLTTFSAVLSLLLIGLGLVSNARAFEAAHDLEVRLDPARAHLTGIDRITVKNHASALRLFLGADVGIDRFLVNGAETDYRRRGTGITVALPAVTDAGSLHLEIHYHGRFDDPAPTDPVNTDNPGFGVSGTISSRGTLLLGGAGWYPSIEMATERFRLEVAGPPGIRAVTTGRPIAATPRHGLSVSAWQIDTPVESLALVAGNFTVREKQAGHLHAATYFLNDDPALADRYLQASLKYMADYETLFGPYPFEKFAVVENFFPTGYGFPSFTLIGGRVLRLPFILHTSLRHEIAHCWWGNGVRIDHAGGNWSEGLTTYVSDYRYRELESENAARDYRQQLLRNFSELVPLSGEIPLTRFYGRHDPLTKAVGYDKAAMVFHMLRRHVGDRVFWETLRRIAIDRMFQATSWGDIQAAFESAGGGSLETFFRQWVRQTGAPQLVLAQIERRSSGTGARVSGIIHQQHPTAFELDVPIQLTGENARLTEKIVVHQARTPFEITVPFVPARLETDPGIDVFRRLDPQEMPPTINRLKSAGDLLVVLPEGPAGDQARQSAARLGRALGIGSLEMIAAADWSPERGRRRNILLMQVDTAPDLAPTWNGRLNVARDTFTLGADDFDRRSHTVVGVFPHPHQADRILAVYFFGGHEDRLRITTKVPHYGRYSYLVFENTRNIAKETWPVTRSPLTHVWPQEPAG